jgi:hypothetical protein
MMKSWIWREENFLCMCDHEIGFIFFRHLFQLIIPINVFYYVRCNLIFNKEIIYLGTGIKKLTWYHRFHSKREANFRVHKILW